MKLTSYTEWENANGMGSNRTQPVSFLVPSLQRTNTENWKQIFPEKELRGHSPNIHIHVFMSDLYIPIIDLPILLQENMWTDDLGINKSLTWTHECGNWD
jgi:hypothetical protein